VSFVIGALNMRGRGRVEVAQSGLAFQLNLSGDLGCTAIARSAAAAHPNSDLAKIAGRIAQKSLKGSVQINTTLDGNSQTLEQARVATSVGIGCGVKPLPIEDLMKLPLELLQQLPKDSARIPLPTFEFPKLNAPRPKATSKLDLASPESDPAQAPAVP
jgi:hypothetical protein